MVVGPDGVAFAASDPAYLGVSFADRGYVKAALAGNVNAGSAALNKVTGKPFAPFAAPIRSGDTVVGAFALIADISFLNEIIVGEKIGATGDAYVVDNTGLIIAHPKAENVFKTNLAELDGTRDFTEEDDGRREGRQQLRLPRGRKDRGLCSRENNGVERRADAARCRIPRRGQRRAEPHPHHQRGGAPRRVPDLLAVLADHHQVPWRAALPLRSWSRPGISPQQLAINQKDEIGELAEALNGMSVKLRGHGGHHPGQRGAGGLTPASRSPRARRSWPKARRARPPRWRRPAHRWRSSPPRWTRWRSTPRASRGRGAGFQLHGAGAPVHRGGVEEPHGDRAAWRASPWTTPWRVPRR